MPRSPRLLFAGSPDFAASHLQGLIHAGFRPAAVYSQPDRPAGRGKHLTPSAVKKLALSQDIEVVQPENFQTQEACSQFAAFEPDLFIVVAYGLLLPQVILDTPRLGCINVHASLLPKWRGAAPIQRAIAAGDDQSGVCVMQMGVGLDTGPVIARSETAIGVHETGGDLHHRLMLLGTDLLVETLPAILAETATTRAQNDALASYANKLTKAEARLNWCQPRAELLNIIRAFNPFPVCHFHVNAQSVRVWAARTGRGFRPVASPPGTILTATDEGIEIAVSDGSLLLTELQLAGKKRLTVAELLRGQAHLFGIGSQLD